MLKGSGEYGFSRRSAAGPLFNLASADAREQTDTHRGASRSPAARDSLPGAGPQGFVPGNREPAGLPGRRALRPAAEFAGDIREELGGGAVTVPPEAEKRERLSVHVYGGKAALCFEADETRGNPARGIPGVPTVALDAAPAVGEREYDWKNRKIRIQMTRLELPQVLAVLIGASPGCEFKNHGPENNKGFSIENQGDKFFVRVFGPGEVRAVPIPVEYAYAVASLVIRQLQLGAPWLCGDGVLHLVRAIRGAMHRTVGEKATG